MSFPQILLKQQQSQLAVALLEETWNEADADQEMRTNEKRAGQGILADETK